MKLERMKMHANQAGKCYRFYSYQTPLYLNLCLSSSKLLLIWKTLEFLHIIMLWLMKNIGIWIFILGRNNPSAKITLIGTSLHTKDIVRTQICNCAVISFPLIQTNWIMLLCLSLTYSSSFSSFFILMQSH